MSVHKDRFIHRLAPLLDQASNSHLQKPHEHSIKYISFKYAITFIF